MPWVPGASAVRCRLPFRLGRARDADALILLDQGLCRFCAACAACVCLSVPCPCWSVLPRALRCRCEVNAHGKRTVRGTTAANTHGHRFVQPSGHVGACTARRPALCEVKTPAPPAALSKVTAHGHAQRPAGNGGQSAAKTKDIHTISGSDQGHTA
eukprot:3539043-Prymnesium_polylepis.2